ncbi:hypothetical protein HF086_013828 [Spodoptera exigua]|uniref:PAT complex subunit CCDC47 n=1 Tax=Spodoptera exigua TaxID=7107 RepID=A0A922SJ29_SPOEX|nr:hypothetical protein HF086_013828 [Spodoptera exigua]
MRWVLLSIFVLLCSTFVAHAFEDQALEDDDFAEFEQFEAEDDELIADFAEDKELPASKPIKGPSQEQFEANVETEDEILVEDEDNEFEHFQDPEEFEGFQDNTPRSSEQPKITISKVPIMIRPRWDAYWLEVRPTPDTLLVRVELGKDDSDPFVLCIAQKKIATRLAKEMQDLALAKCEKRRQKVAEAWLRGAHAARQEQAAARREEKRKLEKERILAEDDPEKQRRWELKEQKRQQKRKTPKMKQLKVKAL